MQLNQIYSKDALLESAKALRAMAREFEIRAEMLDQNRNYRPIPALDRAPIIQAGNALKSLPCFPDVSKKLRQSVAGRYFVEFEAFDRHARSLMARERSRIADVKRRRARDMKAKKVKNVDIARALKVSPARVSQMVNADPDRDEAKRLGVSKAVYIARIKT